MGESARRQGECGEACADSSMMRTFCKDLVIVKVLGGCCNHQRKLGELRALRWCMEGIGQCCTRHCHSVRGVGLNKLKHVRISGKDQALWPIIWPQAQCHRRRNKRVCTDMYIAGL